MNAQYLYKLFDYVATHNNTNPDHQISVGIGLAMYIADGCPLPDGLTRKDVTGYISRHYERLVAAYAEGGYEVFAAAVARLDARDAAKAAEEAAHD